MTQGIVLAMPVGARGQQYRVNRDHVAAEAITALARLADAVHSRLATTVAEWDIPPVYAAMFGSWAAGTAQPGSDLDLSLVRPMDADDDVWEAQVTDLERAATAWTGNDARAYVIDDEELEILAAADDATVMAIVHEGHPFHGDQSVLRRRITRARRALVARAATT